MTRSKRTSKKNRSAARFFTSQPCRACGRTLRYSTNGACVACSRQRAKFQRARDTGRLDAAVDAWIDAIPDGALPAVDDCLARNLTYGMIRQAVLDVWGDDPEHATSAKAWIGSPSKGPFSFEFCCDVLGLDRGVVAQAIFSGRVRSLPEPTL